MKLVRVNIDTHIEYVVYMLRDCPICRAEGFQTLNRIEVNCNGRTLIASLNIINSGILSNGEAGLSESAWQALGAREGDHARFSHPTPVDSMRFVRSKMYGNSLRKEEFESILHDIIRGRYANIEIAAFIVACSGDRLSLAEITALTQSMTAAGHKLLWSREKIVDKHCVGGLPGNRTTPVIVAIVAEAGLMFPKTSSRAITSPAGTADTMEVITNVLMDVPQIINVVERQNGCFAWGGSVNLSPADDILIRIERALEVDSEGQMIASVLSKKSAAGATHVVIDIPVGATAKVRTMERAEKLRHYFITVGAAMGITVKVVITDGNQPVGTGIGPALEAFDVLSVLRNEKNCPADLKERSLLLAGGLMEMAGHCAAGEGIKKARVILESGAAYKRFVNICNEQGRFTEPEAAPYFSEVKAAKSGTVTAINNRKLARVAKLAGAPAQPSAGIRLFVRLQARVAAGDLLYVVFAEGKGELNYALDYLKGEKEIISIT